MGSGLVDVRMQIISCLYEFLIGQSQKGQSLLSQRGPYCQSIKNTEIMNPSWAFIALHSTLCSLCLRFHLFMVCFYLTYSSNKLYIPRGLELACFPLSFYCQCLVWSWYMMQLCRPLYWLKASRGEWDCYTAGKEGHRVCPGHGRLRTDTELDL